MKHIIPAIFVTVISNIFTLTVMAGDGITNYYAVICGITDYKTIPNTLYCGKDAKDFYNKLLTASNWKKENMILLTDSAATMDGIQTAIENMAGRSDDDDVCLFFFSGHGSYGPDGYPYDETDGYDEYLCPYDATDSPYDNIRDDEFGDWISTLPTNKFVVILNACYSGGQIKGTGLDKEMIGIGSGPQKGDGFAADLLNLKIDDIDDNGRGVAITSSDDDETSWETSEFHNGIFTHYLIESLNDDVDADRDNGISVQECFNYLYPKVRAYTISNPITTTQTPKLYNAYGSVLDFYLLRPAIKKCTVKAGSYDYSDSISFSGTINALNSDFAYSSSVSVAFDSNDMNTQTISFPINAVTFANNIYKYSGTENGIRKSFSCNPTTNKFSFSASKLDLSGLGCPITVNFAIGTHAMVCDINEAMVNGKRPIPIVLMMDVINSLRVDKVTLRRGTTIPNSDVLTVKGGFSTQSVLDCNLAANDFNVLVDSQQFTIPTGTLKANRTGDRFKCSNYKLYDGDLNLIAIISADFNFKTGAFSLTIKNTDFTASTGTANLYLESGSFNANADVTLP